MINTLIYYYISLGKTVSHSFYKGDAHVKKFVDLCKPTYQRTYNRS